MSDPLIQYYNKRAAEYEAIYAKPERQADLQALSKILQGIFHQAEVLEIACGTGFWTQKMAETASRILATDINESVLEIARSKSFPVQNVQFEQADLYELQPGQTWPNLFGGFIWSHIKVEELDHFVDKVNSLVRPGGTVVFVDNRYVAGSSTPIAERDAQGNTYQNRLLEDGTAHRVLKNFPERETLERVLTGKSQHFQYTALQYFWVCSYQTCIPGTTI